MHLYPVEKLLFLSLSVGTLFLFFLFHFFSCSNPFISKLGPQFLLTLRSLRLKSVGPRLQTSFLNSGWTLKLLAKLQHLHPFLDLHYICIYLKLISSLHLLFKVWRLQHWTGKIILKATALLYEQKRFQQPYRYKL